MNRQNSFRPAESDSLEPDGYPATRWTSRRCAQTTDPIFCGWIVVGVAFILLAISAGITYSTPVMFPFFETDFTIGRGQAAFVFSCSQVMAFVVGPFAGSLAEKLGPRMVVGGGLSVLAAGRLGSALAQSYGELVFSYGGRVLTSPVL